MTNTLTDGLIRHYFILLIGYCLRVSAEDADLGINGEIYYSLLNETEQFSIHPTSGVITLTRPLKFVERSLHELTVIANDRGISSNTLNRISQSSKARVKIKIVQVSVRPYSAPF